MIFGGGFIVRTTHYFFGNHASKVLQFTMEKSSEKVLELKNHGSVTVVFDINATRILDGGKCVWDGTRGTLNLGYFFAGEGERTIMPSLLNK